MVQITSTKKMKHLRSSCTVEGLQNFIQYGGSSACIYQLLSMTGPDRFVQN